MKIKRWLRWSLAGVLSAWLGWASADPVTLQGEVLQKGSGDPILGASVYVVDNDSINATSDEHGRFTLELPAPGDYTLGAVAVGFESARQIPVTSDNTARGLTKKIFLRQDFTIPPVVVRAERNAERVSKTIITGEELSQVPGANGDPLKALQTLPGITVAHYFGAPAIRGSNPEDNVYYIDGVPVGFLFHFGGLVSVLPANIVDDFNLYAAAFGPEYADVTGAVIDVALRKPRTDRLGGKVDISLIAASGLIEGPISAHQSVLFSARRSYFDFLFPPFESEPGVTEYLPDYSDYQGKYIWEVNAANTLTLNTHGAADSAKSTYAADSDEVKRDPDMAGNHLYNVSYHTQNIEWNTRISATAVNKTYLGRTQKILYASNGTAFHMNEVSDDLFLRDEFRFEPAPNHAVMIGGNYSRLGLSQDFDFKYIACGFGESCDLDAGVRTQYKNNFLVQRVFLFAKDRWRVAPDLTLIGGLHWTRDDYQERAYIEPRLGVEWDWTARTLISAGWGKYNQFPQFGESSLGGLGALLSDVFGNPNLQSQRATHSVLGMSQKLDAGWTWKLEGYYKTFDDLVIPDRHVNFTNGASGEAHGVELLVKKDRSTLWSGWLSATYSQSRRRIDATGENFPISFDQPVIVTGVLSYKHSAAWSYGARWTYHSGNPYTPVIGRTLKADNKTYMPVNGEYNSLRAPAYHRLDLRADKHLVYNTWKVNLYLEVINAYFRRNIQGYEYNADFSERKPSYSLPFFFPFFGVEMEF